MAPPIIAFYSREGADAAGRQLAEIHAWDYDRLEHVHDYIQWLFPLPERSQFNPLAPVLDEAQIAAFRASAQLRAALLNSLDMMLDFYGFERQGVAVVRSRRWNERSRNWLTLGNHNHLRITRILRSLSLLGLRDRAAEFFRALSEVYAERPEAISEHTYEFWTNALDA